MKQKAAVVLRTALESVGVIFVGKNGEGPRVRMCWGAKPPLRQSDFMRAFGALCLPRCWVVIILLISEDEGWGMFLCMKCSPVNSSRIRLLHRLA